MASRRTLKAAEAIREVVAMSLLTDIKDPRVRNVTVTKVEVAGDMRSAKIYVSIMGDEKMQTLSLRGLESSAGFLQTKVAKRIDTRFTPRISFVIDQGVKKQLEVARILREVLPSSSKTEETPLEELSSEEAAALATATENSSSPASPDRDETIAPR